MVLTIKPYDPRTKISDIAPGETKHPAGSGTIRFDLRILTRYAEVIIDFGGFQDLVSWYDSLSVEGSGSWTLRMRALLSNEELLKKIYPGMTIEVYCARNDDPLIGVNRDPSKINRIDTTPELPLPPPPSPITTNPLTVSGGAPVHGTGGINGSNANMTKALIIIARGESNFNPTVSNSGGSGAQGAFQFMPDSRARAIELGLGDPTAGNISAQAIVAEKWLRYTHPDAAKLIDSGQVLAGLASMPYEWTSVPGGKEESEFWRTAEGKAYLQSVLGGSLGSSSTASVGAEASGTIGDGTEAKGTVGGGAEASGTIGSKTTVTVAPTPQTVLGKPVKPVEDPYLDNCPHLLLRGVITDYGRSTSESGETVLTLTGESYGKVYKDAFVLADLKAPELQRAAPEVRNATIVPFGVTIIYYRLLKEWVEGFWGNETGWEARTRPIPFPPNYLTRINNDGSVWSNLQYLAIEGFFHIFVDHTGAIVWEKLPWSSRDQSLIAGRNWEDLQILEVPSWKIINWNDRVSQQGVTNYIRCVPTMQGTSGGQDFSGYPGFIYNIGSIRQHGGPNKREFMFPIGISGEQYYTSELRRKQQATAMSFTALTALESIRWYDRPVQRVGITVRGESAWRIHTRVKITEDWHAPDAKSGEYYVASRTHQIDVSRGLWTTSLDLVRDRRTRYLGIGVGEMPIITDEVVTDTKVKFDITKDPFNTLDRAALASLANDRFTQLGSAKLDQAALKADLKDQAAPNSFGKVITAEQNYLRIPLVPDEYWWFNRLTGKVERLGNDPIAYARKEVIPKLGQPNKPLITVTPISSNGIVAPTGPAAPFTPVDRIDITYLYHTHAPPHEAWDFTLYRGDNVITPIPSPISGKVTKAEVISGYGNAVEVTGSDGQVWFMGHLDSIAVSSGQDVQRGQTLGNQGSTGRSSGEHVHLEIGNQSTQRLPHDTTAGALRGYFDFICGGSRKLTGGSF